LDEIFIYAIVDSSTVTFGTVIIIWNSHNQAVSFNFQIF